MRGSRELPDGLTRLHKIAEPSERRVEFRQAMASLAAAAADLRPVPLEGLDPAALRDSTKVALADRLFEDLDWLTPEHASGAIYELAGALPPSDEKRELGRRVLRALHDGNAATFTLLATQLATGSRRGLSGVAVRARVALALDLPIGSGVRADPLALALVARRDLAAEWLALPSTGALPSRRLAARLLERASREAARRAAGGDDTMLGIFSRPDVAETTARLLSDREPLVWRHVATARGLLARAIPRLGVEIEEALHPSLSPTEWRRGAASLAATIAIDPGLALRRCHDLLGSETMKKDPGIAAAMVLGLPRAAEVEPAAAEDLLTTLVRAGGLDAIEALIEIRSERVGGEVGDWAARLALARLREDALQHTDGDDGRAALLRALDADLRPPSEREHHETLRDLLDEARLAFVEQDARAAYTKAGEVLAVVDQRLDALERSRDRSREERVAAFVRLRELDGVLLETSALADLLLLGGHRSDERDRADRSASVASRSLEPLFERLTAWLLEREREPVEHGAKIAHPSLRLRRMRTLLHVVDADGSHAEERSPELRARRLQTARFLLRRMRDDAPSGLRRVVGASVARACDALLRDDVAELGDVLVAVAAHVPAEHDIVTLAEATMVPEVQATFRAYATLIERTERSARVTEVRATTGLEALRELVRQMPGAGSPRVEAMRQALWALADAIETLSEAGSLAEIAGELDGQTGSLVPPLGEAAEGLAHLVRGARRRLGLEVSDDERPGGEIRMLDVAVLRAARGAADGEEFDVATLAEAIQGAVHALRQDLPGPVAEVAANVLAMIVALPPVAARRSRPPRPTARSRDAALPPWMPPSRTLGGFYVLRALGAGAVGSVFVARRAEQRADEKAPKFALKVPEYAGTVARTLSEEEFLQLFREEAGALLAVPPHENLAKLVTFDVGARPKPILVMELVDGPTLERIVETGALDMERAVAVIDGIGAGLSAMHATGVGHLDLKPSNVILRDPDGPGPALETPVLVDFGLAGRKVRPGCATSSYGAPEVWGLVPKGYAPRPAEVDVYAYACLVYEVLTGQTLFMGPTDMAIITMHLQHDGELLALDALRGVEPALTPLVETLRLALRQDPRRRPSVDDVREAVAEVRGVLAAMRWPLPVAALVAA